MEAAKVRLLQTNDDWRERYEDLVKTGLITDTLFWSDKRASIETTQAYLAMLEASSKEHGMSSQQKAAAVLRKIRGVTDGKGEVKFKLTAEIIQAIYTNLPQVKTIHDDFVGSKMLTEKDFWTQFCTSKTFGSELGVGEEFIGKEGNIIDREFEKLNEKPISENTVIEIDKQRPVEPNLDLSRNEVNDFVGREPLVDKPITNTIKQLNSSSIRAMQALSDCPITIEDANEDFELAAPQPEKSATPSISAKPEINEEVDGLLPFQEYDPKQFYNAKLLKFDEFQEHVLGSKSSSTPFITISESDFTSNHFELTKRLYMNILQVLRIFWRLPTGPDRMNSVNMLMVALDKLLSDFTLIELAEEERQKANLLLSGVYKSVDLAREKSLDNKPK